MHFSHEGEEEKGKTGGILEKILLGRAIDPEDKAFANLASLFHFIDDTTIEKEFKELAILQRYGIEKRLYSLVYEHNLINAVDLSAILDAMFLRSELYQKQFVSYRFQEPDNAIFNEFIQVSPETIAKAVSRQGELEEKGIPSTLDEILSNEFGCTFTPNMLSFCLDLEETLSQLSIKRSIISIAADKNWLPLSIDQIIPKIEEKKLSLSFTEEDVNSRIREDIGILLGQLFIHIGGISQEKVKKSLQIWSETEEWGIDLRFSEILFYLEYLEFERLRDIVDTFNQFIPVNEEIRLDIFHFDEREKRLLSDLSEENLIQGGEEKCKILRKILKNIDLLIPLSDLMAIQGYVDKSSLHEIWMKNIGDKLISLEERQYLDYYITHEIISQEILSSLLITKAWLQKKGIDKSLIELIKSQQQAGVIAEYHSLEEMSLDSELVPENEVKEEPAEQPNEEEKELVDLVEDSQQTEDSLALLGQAPPLVEREETHVEESYSNPLSTPQEDPPAEQPNEEKKEFIDLVEDSQQTEDSLALLGQAPPLVEREESHVEESYSNPSSTPQEEHPAEQAINDHQDWNKILQDELQIQPLISDVHNTPANNVEESGSQITWDSLMEGTTESVKDDEKSEEENLSIQSLSAPIEEARSIEELVEQGEITQVGSFKIIEKIGIGGMGVIYKASQIGTNKTVALKMISPRYAQSPNYHERFLREIEIAKRLEHPNIVTTYEVGVIHGIHYMAMEYIEGENIFNRIKREGRIGTMESTKIILQVAKALQYAHENGLVHRDIKPSHFLIDKDGTVKLCDLGLAKSSFTPESASDLQPVALGTPAYISPEQVRGFKDIDIRSDIYSLGASFYHMVVGEVPFPASSPIEAATKHITEKIPWAREKSPKIPIEISNIIQKMMAKNFDDRFQTPAELIQRLERLLEIPDTASNSPSAKVSHKKIPVPSKKLKILLWLGVIIFLSVVVVEMIFIMYFVYFFKW